MDEPRECRLAAILARGLLRVRQRDERLNVQTDICEVQKACGQHTSDEHDPADNAVHQTGDQV